MSKNISEYSISELEKVLEKKKKEEELKKPKVILTEDNVDIYRIIRLAKTYLEIPDFAERWAYEELMEIVYGEEIWEYLNKNK